MLNDLYEKWNRLSVLGLLLTGFGMSVIGDATVSKLRGKGWFVKGTIGLIIFNAGLAFFAEAVKNRTLYEVELNKLRKDG